SDDVSSPVALFGLAHPRGRIPTAERQQWITHPPAPLAKAAERGAALYAGRNPAPFPDRQQGREQFRTPCRYFGADIDGERPRLRVLGPWIELHGHETSREVFRDRQAVSGQDHK